MNQTQSMTGFARAVREIAGRRITVEAKSVNHRYLDLRFHLPRDLMTFETQLSALCRERFDRGRIEIWANFGAGDTSVKVRWNRSLARRIVGALTEMKKELGVAGEPELALLAAQKDLITLEEPDPLADDAWPQVAEAFAAAFDALATMRLNEGSNLVEDLSARLTNLGRLVDGIEAQSSGGVEAYRVKLHKRLEELLGDGGPVSEDRLAQEIAIFADRTDITEEIVRARSHLGEFGKALAEGGSLGRKLDFMVQELFREINTASNKAQDPELSRTAVEAKAELEKIREQIQNLQ